MELIFLCVVLSIFSGVIATRRIVAKNAEVLESNAQGKRAELPSDFDKEPRAIDLFNKHVTMARARAVHVQDECLTVIYARENKTKGRIKFNMDTAFDDVNEGDVGVLVIIEQEIVGRRPFYKFIRDTEIPTIHDVLELGTGDDLTDKIYAAALKSGIDQPKQLTNGSDQENKSDETHMDMEMHKADRWQRAASRDR